jgi:hypothetical protein
MKYCSICGCEERETGTELLHLPLYVNGSEGVGVCFSCRMTVTEFLRGMKSACGRTRLSSFRKFKGNGVNRDDS